MSVFVAGCMVGALAMFVTLAVVFAAARRHERRLRRSRQLTLEFVGPAARGDLVDWPFRAPPRPAKPARPTYLEQTR